MSTGNFRVGKPIDVTPYILPGIFRVDSLETKRSFFGHGENVLLEMRRLVDQLKAGDCENEELQTDFVTYGVENFQFILLDRGDEFFDAKARKKQVEISKKTWTGALY